MRLASASKNWVNAVRTCNIDEEIGWDPVSKWLVVTRSCVFSMTLLSALIGGLLASVDGYSSIGRLLLISLGLVIAHAANNMVNDLFDVREGVDTEDYPRAKYAPHPILDNLVSREKLIAAILLCYLVDFAIAIYFVKLVGWGVMAFAFAGVFLSVFYVAPPLKLKHRGMGEPAIFLIWGPLMICGTYYVLAGEVSWDIALASVPYGLGVMAVLMGKHLDKAEKDREKGINSLPVILGDERGRLATELMVWAYYLVITALVVTNKLPLLAILALVSIPKAGRFIHTLHQGIPATPVIAFAMAKDVIPADLKKKFDPNMSEEDFPLWPLWYVAWGVWWIRTAGGWFVLGLLLAAIF